MTDDRAERAFARAFDEHSDEWRPLDPSEIIALSVNDDPDRDRVVAIHRRRPRTPWLYAVAAVAAFILCLPFLGVLLGRTSYSGNSSAPAAAPSWASESPAPRHEDAAGRPPTGVPAAGPWAPRLDSPPGQRWESMLDVAVLVPDTWGYGTAPGTDWCGEPGYRRPDRPFVQRTPLSQPVRAIACPEPMPDDLRQTHLTWRPAEPADRDGSVVTGGWVRVSRVVGEVLLSVEVPADQSGLAAEILGTARVVEAGPR